MDQESKKGGYRKRGRGDTLVDLKTSARPLKSARLAAASLVVAIATHQSECRQKTLRDMRNIFSYTNICVAEHLFLTF